LGDRCDRVNESPTIFIQVTVLVLWWCSPVNVT